MSTLAIWCVVQSRDVRSRVFSRSLIVVSHMGNAEVAFVEAGVKVDSQ